MLVIDDATIDRRQMRTLLQREGYEVLEAENGQKGFEIALEQQPDIIVSDVIMPVMDGLELCRRIRGCPDTRGTFFVLATSLEDSASRMESLKAGCDEYLHKPVMPEELVLRMRGALRARRQQEELEEAYSRLRRMLVQVNRQQEDVAQDITLARRVQRRLLPRQLPEPKGYSFGYFLEPSDVVGGDYLDILDFGDCVGLVEADVSGHGFPAAIVTGMFHAWIHAEFRSDTRLDDFIRRLNAYILEHTLPEMHITAFVGLCHIDSGEIEYASAGHPEPTLFGPEGIQTLPAGNTGALGLFPDIHIEINRCRLPREGGLCVFSDGILDSFADELESSPFHFPSLLREAVARNADGPAWLFNQAVLLNGRPPRDDVAMLIVHKKE